MNILVACEESQAVCLAFRSFGHDAYSCDLKPCSGGFPEYHIQDDAIKVASSFTWDMIVAHPPCTFLTKAAANRLFVNGSLNADRYLKGKEAADFFMKFYRLEVPRLCIENPVPLKIFDLPAYSQIVSPHEYGDDRRKMTCLWLRGLPPLMPILSGRCVTLDPVSLVFSCNGKDRQTNRSKTSPFLALAMAEQWG